MYSQIKFVRRRRGLTLIELIVVLFVLAAVAGLVIPALTSVNSETHGATGAAGITRLDNSMRLEEARKGFVGAAGYDSLIDSDNNVINYLSGGNMWSTYLTPTEVAPGGTDTVTSLDGSVTVTSGRVYSALVAAGVTELMQMRKKSDIDAGTGDATFNNTESIIDFVTNGGYVAVLNDGATDLQLDPTGVYVAFGVGSDSQLAGDVFAEAPTFMPMVGSSNDTYSNLVVIYRIPTTGMALARYAGTGMPMMPGIRSATAHIGVYHSARDQ